MGWREDLRPASFRGVEFKVESHDFETGRRGPDHEFAQRNQPFAEDTGRKARQYSVTAYILGSDYFADRDALIAACEKEGSGELIHPYYGRLDVVCRSCKVRESSRDGGFVAFTMSFSEAGVQLFPDSKADTSFNVNQSVLGVITGSKDSFAEKFNILKQPAFVVKSATDKIKSFSAKLSSLSKGYSQTAADITDFAFSIRKLNASVGDLVRKPQELAEQMSSAIGFLRTAAGKTEESLAALKNMLNFGDDDPPITRSTPTRVQQDVNQRALNNMIKEIALANAIQAASESTFVSIDDAKTERVTLIDAIDSQMNVASDEVYQAQQTMLKTLIQAVPNPDQNLAAVTSITPVETTNSLSLAYDLYESLDLEQDVIDRNSIAHPGFIPGGDALEILRSV